MFYFILCVRYSVLYRYKLFFNVYHFYYMVETIFLNKARVQSLDFVVIRFFVLPV